MEWVKLGIMSIIVSTIFITLYKYLSIYTQWKPLVLNMLIFMSMISILIIITNRKYSFIDIRKDNHFLILLMSINITLFIYFAYRSVSISPNPGYVSLIFATSTIPILLISYYFFDGHINRYSILGIIIVLIGLYNLINSIEKKHLNND